MRRLFLIVPILVMVCVSLFAVPPTAPCMSFNGNIYDNQGKSPKPADAPAGLEDENQVYMFLHNGRPALWYSGHLWLKRADGRTCQTVDWKPAGDHAQNAAKMTVYGVCALIGGLLIYSGVRKLGLSRQERA